ncbi:McrC family protein [Helicobacter felistomachi]|uniref:McrC family protein n=1 Tax=Helicobacter felistomachi TaxID=3040201 RepID=UPI0025736335|nr:McrC family protein [Helicobacter sp. NHP21005]
MLKFEDSDTLKTQNYVGLIQIEGFCIEILPKVCEYDEHDLERHTSCNKKISQLDTLKFQEYAREFIKPQTNLELLKEPTCPICYAKQILYNCLSTLQDMSFKQTHFSQLDSAHLPILDVFVCMFLDECMELIKRGLKRDYLGVSENHHYLKGKLEFPSHLKINLVHKERFYTTSDEYSLDVAPNRLIKSTLETFKTLALSPQTQEKLNAVRFVFDEISTSKNIDADFAKSAHASRFKEYENLLAWCNLFLRKKSLMAYSGSNQAYALLFPMEKLFESFVGAWLQRSLRGYDVSLQEQSRHLAKDENSQNCFEMRPDIVLRDKEEVLILDTKWKTPKENKEPLRADLYQMWAYASKYASVELIGKQRRVSVWLVYPWQGSGSTSTWTFKASELFSADGIQLTLKYFPLSL